MLLCFPGLRLFPHALLNLASIYLISFLSLFSLFFLNTLHPSFGFRACPYSLFRLRFSSPLRSYFFLFYFFPLIFSSFSYPFPLLLIPSFIHSLSLFCFFISPSLSLLLSPSLPPASQIAHEGLALWKLRLKWKASCKCLWRDSIQRRDCLNRYVRLYDKKYAHLECFFI